MARKARVDLAIPKDGRVAYNRIADCDDQRHTVPIRAKDTPARCKSPARPARNECGVTEATSPLAAESWSGNAANNSSRGESEGFQEAAGSRRGGAMIAATAEA